MTIPGPEGISIPGLQKGTYRHYKGDLVEVTGLALHSETLEPLVLYRHVSGARAGETYSWARPYAMFMEEVELDGHRLPRFERISPSA